MPKSKNKTVVVAQTDEVNGEHTECEADPLQKMQTRIEQLEKEVKQKTEECHILRTQNNRLELDLVEANMRRATHTNENAEVHRMKEHSEEVLTKAKSIIFEKMKIIKNQELQIDAFNAQISSLKDVIGITKNMLDIRNMEVKHLQDQIDTMNNKVAAEKERQELVHKKLEKMLRMNADLKREYETQLVLFNALRDRYSERELAKGLVSEVSEGIANGTESNDSQSQSSITTDETPPEPKTQEKDTKTD